MIARVFSGLRPGRLRYTMANVNDEKDNESREECGDGDQEPIQMVQFLGERRSLYWKQPKTCVPS